MADPRFFNRAGPFRAAELARLIGAEIAAGGDGDLEIRDVAPLDRASSGDLSFLDNRKYIDAFARSTAAACIVEPRFCDQAPAGMVLFLSSTPYKAYALAAAALYPPTPPTPGVADSAVVDPTAEIGPGCRIGPGAVIGPGVVLGARCDIDANVVIGQAVRVGEDSIIGANASLSHCVIGVRSLIHPGVRIGQRGFGFAIDPAGHIKVPQLGRVIIGNDVEIGANSTVDRGAGPDTVIGDGTMIDNLVQIGHNVHIGKGCIIIAQVGIGGSTVLEDYVVVAAQVGIAGHLRIGTGAQIAAKSGLMRDVAPGARMAGTPAVPARQFFRQVAMIEKLVKKKGR
jgi:UDP-3-O-[3-hydroxymyristoyl] glucosamine N-acyltransferase